MTMGIVKDLSNDIFRYTLYHLFFLTFVIVQVYLCCDLFRKIYEEKVLACDVFLKRV